MLIKYWLKDLLTYRGDENKLLMSKGIFLYDYVDSTERLCENTGFPDRMLFESRMKNGKIMCNEVDYKRNKKAFQKLGFTNLGQWNVFYCALDVLFLRVLLLKKRNDSMKSKRGSKIMRTPSMSAFSGLSCMRHSKAYPQSMPTPEIYRYISI